MDAGESVSATLRREFGEEAMNSLEATPEEKVEIEEAIKDLFEHGQEVCMLTHCSEFHLMKMCMFIAQAFFFFFSSFFCDTASYHLADSNFH